MNILITGARGMIGTALYNNLNNVKRNNYKGRENIKIDEIFLYDIDSTERELDEYCQKADFVFNLAGINRPQDEAEFMSGNYMFACRLLQKLKQYNNKAPVMLSSSVQATMMGRYIGSKYGESKKAGEDIFFSYGEENDVKVAVYRFPNIMGHSRPRYNSVISTFCWAVANDEEYIVDDRNTELEILYIDNLVEGLLDLLEGKELHCNYEGAKAIVCSEGKYCYIPETYNVTLGKIVDLLEQFRTTDSALYIPSMPKNSFENRLYSLYLTYLPVDKFKHELKMNIDDRGSFTELLHMNDCGQVSINISKPGITKGQHWHNSKWEIFIVVSGHGLIQERNINTGEKIEFEVRGERIEAVYMIPGWTHNIINLSETENLVTVMTCNEVFDPNRPDTFFEIV